MTTIINMSDARKAMDLNFAVGQTLMLEGASGIGKTFGAHDYVDDQPEDYGLFRALGMEPGPIRTSDYAAFEAPDPGFWVPFGYVVVHADVRGMWRSEGRATWLSPQDAEDYFDLIEWAAAQPWSTGRVGLCGVSYLAMSQWAVAPLRPPHLAAIMPWEGVSDMYREMAFHGGMRETGFVPSFYRQRVRAHHNPAFPLGEDLLDQIQRHPLDDEYWASRRPDLARLKSPDCSTAHPGPGPHRRRASWLPTSDTRRRQQPSRRCLARRCSVRSSKTMRRSAGSARPVS